MKWKCLLMVAAVAAGCLCYPILSQDQAKPLYLDPRQPVELRIEDLLARMTLKEKVGQMNMPSVYIGQLGRDPATSGRAAVSSPWPTTPYKWARASRRSISTSCKSWLSKRPACAFRCSRPRKARTG